MVETAFRPFFQFLHPSVSLAIGFLFLFVFFLALFCRLSLGFGKARLLAPLPLAWFLCSFWEWSKIGKTYPTWIDVAILYPGLLLLSVAFLVIWVLSLLKNMKAGGGPDAFADSASGNAWRMYEILSPICSPLFAKVPMEHIIAKPLIGVGVAVGTAIGVGILCGALSSSFSMGFVVFGGMTLLLIALFIAIFYAVYLWLESMGRRAKILSSIGDSLEQLLESLEKVQNSITALEPEIHSRLHILPADFSERFGRLRRIYSAIHERAERIERLMLSASEVELSAAQELYQHPIEIGHDARVALQSGAHETIHLAPEQWQIIVVKCGEEAVFLQSEIRRLYD